MGNGSKLDKLYSDGSGSKLDQLYSSGGSDDATKAATRERRSNDMVDRSLQRAMRSGTPAERIAAARTYQERSSQPGYQQGGGIGSSETNQQRDQETGNKFIAEGLRLDSNKPANVIESAANNLPSSSQVPVPGGAVAPAGEDGKAPYTPIPSTKAPTASSTPSAGQSATPPVTTPPVAVQETGNDTPEVPDWRQQRATALEALKGKFTKQDEANALAEKAAPQGIDPKYQVPKETLDMESKFDAMIADRPADQKAMFSKMSESDKAAMIQKNESLKTAREEIEKLGPDKNSNAEQAKALIPSAKKELQSIRDTQSDMEEGLGRYDARKEVRESGRILTQDKEKEALSILGELPNSEYQFDKNGPNILVESKPSPTKEVAPSTAKELDWNEDFGSMSPSDPRYKALQIKNSSYAKAWIETPGSLIPALRRDLSKSPQAQIKEKARSRMVSEAIEKGVDISGITKQDPSFHKQYEDAKKQKTKSPDQAFNDVNIQKDRTYDGIINSVRERSNFLQRYA